MHLPPHARQAADPTRLAWAAEVLNSVDELDGDERAALHLIYGRGMTQKQVARELALPEAAVGRCVARGLRRLTAHLIES